MTWREFREACESPEVITSHVATKMARDVYGGVALTELISLTEKAQRGEGEDWTRGEDGKLWITMTQNKLSDMAAGRFFTRRQCSVALKVLHGKRLIKRVVRSPRDGGHAITHVWLDYEALRPAFKTAAEEEEEDIRRTERVQIEFAEALRRGEWREVNDE